MAAPSRNVTIALTDLRVGISLPADVSDARNTSVLLLRKGIPITAAFLVQLQRRGIKHVTVDEQSAAILRGGPAAPEKPPVARSPKQPQTKPAVVRPLDRMQQNFNPLPAAEAAKQVAETKAAHSQNLHEVFASAKRRSAANGQIARQIVAESVEHMMSDIDAFLKIALQTTESSEVYEHCLSTAQLAMSVGVVQGLDEEAIHDLGAGCMLSRIGQSEAASRSSEQTRTLSNIELMDLKRTPARTFDCLQGMDGISVGARNVAYQIFERFNGTGYPRGRAGNQITWLARIAAVCDVYVALTSPRPHRIPFEPYHALEILLQDTREGKFDPAAIRALLKTIGLFPIGSYVRLVDGGIGQVVRNHHDAYDRPVVHLMFDADGSNIREREQTIDLQTDLEQRIDSAISLEIVQELLYQSVSEPFHFEDEDFSLQDRQLTMAFD